MSPSHVIILRQRVRAGDCYPIALLSRVKAQNALTTKAESSRVLRRAMPLRDGEPYCLWRPLEIVPVQKASRSLQWFEEVTAVVTVL